MRTPSREYTRPLVSCPRNNMAFAAGQLAVFQGASDEHILIDTWRFVSIQSVRSFLAGLREPAKRASRCESGKTE
jgi:hypothetical protein